MVSKKVDIFPMGELYDSSSSSDSDSDFDSELDFKKKVSKYIRYVFYKLYYFFSFIVNWFSKLIKNEKKEKPKVITTDMIIKEYEEKEYKRFLKIFENENSNANMNKEFYDIDLYKETVTDVNNELEKQWKSRILYENTPRGNIVMYYEIF